MSTAQQFSLFDRWRDARDELPADGETVLAYIWIENPEDAIFKEHLIPHGTGALSGPGVHKYEAGFVAEGSHKPIAYWQPIEPLGVGQQQ